MSDDVRTNALKHAWWVERDAIGIVKRSEDTSSKYVSISGTGKTAYAHVVKYDEDFIATAGTGGTDGIRLGESPNIPEEFHEALANFVIARGYELKKDGIPQAQYFRSLFNESIREGKKYTNQNRDGTAYSVAGYDY